MELFQTTLHLPASLPRIQQEFIAQIGENAFKLFDIRVGIFIVILIEQIG